jgi:hypothetical protein
MSETLAPCPFCGGEAKIVRRTGAFGVRCTEYGEIEHFVQSYGGTEADAVAAWNRRAPDPELSRLSLRVGELEEGWQPIESAPKDETYVLTYQPDKSSWPLQIQHWLTGDDRGRAALDASGPCDGNWCDYEGYWCAHPPTHWRTLPDPPASRLLSQPQDHQVQRDGEEGRGFSPSLPDVDGDPIPAISTSEGL